MSEKKAIKSVAIIGAGASGAVTAAAFKAENYFDTIRVFERRDRPGGTWIYDADPQPELQIHPGALPPDIDPPLNVPDALPAVLAPSTQERYSKTPVYNSLTTNVPDIAMSFSDKRFAYGPFAPHYVPQQYIADYFSSHRTDSFLVLNTTVEDISRIPPSEAGSGAERWKLVLRKYDSSRHIDIWWEETFDAVVLANGHYAVPYIPPVKGLEAYTQKFPDRVVHSKYYRTPLVYANKKVLIIGNSASGHDVTAELVSAAQLPVYQSRRSKSRWDGKEPPEGIAWKTVVQEYREDGRIVFEDGSHLDDVDKVIYCTGYQPSYPFWNAAANGRPLFDYTQRKLIAGYWHTFFQDFSTLAVVGVQRALTFRSFEYQAVALARLFSGRNALALPPVEEQLRWERDQLEKARREGRKFHDITWDTGDTFEWLDGLYKIAGLSTLHGEGRIPPVLTPEMIWALENVKKYPEPDQSDDDDDDDADVEGNEHSNVSRKNAIKGDEAEWVVVPRTKKDSLAFI
ncbi:hypothetical protein BX600DRAFT_476148 [Xylariales sp. PMI_506]|nr:hypothetical protein BX600DRAFT_476148 [Xylariales sp. PMI_506]